MHQNNASGCTQSSAPTHQPTSKLRQGNAHVPQTRSDWSLVLSSLPDNWVLTPVKDKRPLRPDWQHEPAIARNELLDLLDKGQKLTSSKSQEWHCKWTGIGLRLGTVSGGLMAIDCDGELAEAYLQQISGGHIPLTPCWTSGKQGRRQLLYQIPPEQWHKIKTLKIDCGQGQYLEFRWDGCQSVLPPSKHPETGQYHWLVSPQDTETADAESAPVATAPSWLLEFIDAQTQHSVLKTDSPSLWEIETPKNEPFSSENSQSSPFSAETPHSVLPSLSSPSNRSDQTFPYSLIPQQWTDLDWARSYLNALAPWRADTYDEWLNIGMALHSVSDALLNDWEDWSRQSPKYQPGACERKWRSFKPTKGISIGSLCHWAKQDGWTSPFEGLQKSSGAFSHTPSAGVGVVPQFTFQNLNFRSPQLALQKSIIGSSPPNSLEKAQIEPPTATFSDSHLSQPFSIPKTTSEDTMNTQQQQPLTLKEAVTLLIMQGLNGSDRNEALFSLSCQYRVSINQLDRYWRELEQEIETKALRPEIQSQLHTILSYSNHRLDVNRIFPQPLAQLLTNCANSLPAPVEGLIVTFLGATAGCVGTGAEIVLKRDSGYTQPCLVRTLLLAETGDMKTGLQKIILEPLKRLEKDALKQYKQELKDYQAALEQGDQSVETPQRKRFLLIDCTPEEMVRIHAQSPRGFLVHHDEWGVYLKGFNKYRNGVGNDREIDLSEFNGDMYIRDRVGDDSLLIERMSVSRTAGYQLSKLHEFIEKNDDLDGFLTRWLVAAPPFATAYKNFCDDNNQTVRELQNLLFSVYQTLRLAPSGSYPLELEAKRLFQDWQHHLVDLRVAETQLNLKGLYPKIEAYTARLALLLHLIEAAVLQKAPDPLVSAATTQKAIYLAQYFLNQALWIYSRKNTNIEGLSGFLAQIHAFALKKGGVLTARQVKQALSCIKNCTKASADFIRGLFVQLAEMGYGVLRGQGIHLGYQAQFAPGPSPQGPNYSSQRASLFNFDYSSPSQQVSNLNFNYSSSSQQVSHFNVDYSSPSQWTSHLNFNYSSPCQQTSNFDWNSFSNSEPFGGTSPTG